MRKLSLWFQWSQNLKILRLSRCMKLEELPALEIGSEAARDGFPKLEELHLCSLESLESIACNAKTMQQLQILWICHCSVLKTLRMEELPNLRELHIWNYAELKELFMEGGDGFPELVYLKLESLKRLDSIVCNAKTMPQLHYLDMSYCGMLNTLRIEELTDLERIDISECPQLEVVEISSLPMLRRLYLSGLEKAESIARPSSVWNEETMPNLEVIEIRGCPLLRRMPKEMEKLPKLKKIAGESDWGWNKLGE